MMHPKHEKVFREQLALLRELKVPPNELREKYTRAHAGRGHARVRGGNSGGVGRAARRSPGWTKHGSGPANVPNVS